MVPLQLSLGTIGILVFPPPFDTTDTLAEDACIEALIFSALQCCFSSLRFT